MMMAPVEKNRRSAQKGMAKLKEYLKANPGPTLHHRTMVLWASTTVEGLLSDSEKQTIIERLSSLQKPDGGWGLATLGDWNATYARITALVDEQIARPRATICP